MGSYRRNGGDGDCVGSILNRLIKDTGAEIFSAPVCKVAKSTRFLQLADGKGNNHPQRVAGNIDYQTEHHGIFKRNIAPIKTFNDKRFHHRAEYPK